jgi:flagellar hook protein FlgE
MPFDTALSGIRAASAELEITGNNIANTSTSGFKSSRAEFGDVYATSVLGASNNSVGAGVEILDISQQFAQGNIAFTDNALDLAVNGNGFFILSQNGDRSYTRSGAFGLDQDGNIVANNGARLRGYTADTAGSITSIEGDLRIETSTIDPRQTTLVEQTLNFDATSQVLPRNGQEFQSLGAEVGLVQTGSDNGYSAQSFTITDPESATTVYSTSANDSAANIAAELNSIVGVTATAQTEATLSNLAGTSTTVTINNVAISATTLGDLQSQINLRTNSSLPGVSAEINPATGDLVITSSVGSDLSISVSGTGAGLDVTGSGTTTASLADGDAATVGGSLTVVIEEGYSVAGFSPDNTVFDSTQIALDEVVVNDFDANDSSTYNSATSTTIYDSFGVQHIMTQYFVKQPYNPLDATSSPNHWVMHVQIDGRDVGNPDPTATDPAAPTGAEYDIYFNPNGTLDTTRTTNFIVSNWTVYNEDGTLANALDPEPAGTLPLPDPPTSSNFEIRVDNSTQFGAAFSVNSVNQDGFSSGQLSGLNVDDSGTIFARFTNGESLTLGQVILADFTNQQGLQPIGDTAWAQTFESGDPIINAPGTSSLGAIQSGALEESNVDLSEQLVALIIAQRNFQASAKTIETADQTTQTIINLR